MILGPRHQQEILRHAHLFCGLGSGARGFNLAIPRVGQVVGRFACAGGIDVDPGALANFERQTGVPGTRMDLFSREQYIRFHGKEPPAGWREATPEDIYQAFGPDVDVAFTSAPCKGFSGLLSASKSKTDKYQALNELTVRGVMLLLEAYKHDPIPIILFENVPRILTRGTKLLAEIKALFHAAGYSVNVDTHDCGVIGNLAQRRERALVIARHMGKVPPFVYQPKHHPLRGVGEVIGKLPLPGDPVAGAMHRIPELQWKTWVRLALVPAGKDWRALNDYAVEAGVLRDYGIVPEHPLRDNALGVNGWGDTAPVLTSQRAPGQGRFSVADPRVSSEWNRDVLGVRDWEKSTGTVAGRSSPTNGAYSVADPRHMGRERAPTYGVKDWSKPVGTVAGESYPTNGAYSVADPRPPADKNQTYQQYGVNEWEDSTGAVSGQSLPGGGSYSVADPRPGYGPDTHRHVLGVNEWNGKPTGTVGGSAKPTTGAHSVADPRLHRKAYSNIYRVVSYAAPGVAVTSRKDSAVADPRPASSDYSSRKYKITPMDDASRAVIGASSTGDGAYAVADPRPQWGIDRHRNILKVTKEDDPAGSITGARSITGGAGIVADSRGNYMTQGHYGVNGWDDSSNAVPGYAKYDRGKWSVADPREVDMAERVGLPAPDERLVCRIIAEDGTWHRPFTTLDLAALQSLFDPEEAFGCQDGVWFARTGFDLVGGSDVTKREWIGNAVPGAAATGMAETIGETLIRARLGQSFMLDTREIWVKPGAMALAVINDQAATRMDGGDYGSVVA